MLRKYIVLSVIVLALINLFFIYQKRQEWKKSLKETGSIQAIVAYHFYAGASYEKISEGYYVVECQEKKEAPVKEYFITLDGKGQFRIMARVEDKGSCYFKYFGSGFVLPDKDGEYKISLGESI